MDYTGWMWGRWFDNREMIRLCLGPFLSEVRAVVAAAVAVVVVVTVVVVWLSLSFLLL